MSDGREKTMAYVDQVLAAVDTFAGVVRFSEHNYHWKKLRVYAEALFERGPFKVGDRVRLTKTPEISETKSWGWLGSKHFLVAGALGTVRYVDFYDGHFCAGIHWDDESWVDPRDGNIRTVPPEERALYHFWETSIERVATERQSAAEEDT